MSEEKTVYQALSAVMAEVQSVRKSDRNEHQKFLFRGIDAVMNAVGPALRKHGVVIVPADVEAHYRDTQTTQGKAAREVTVIVTYRAYGPRGDYIEMKAPGESLDSGDKGTPKAMSVAYRTLLLQALTVPTDDPEPDAETFHRAPPVSPPAPVDSKQLQRIAILAGELGVDRDKKLAAAAYVSGREVASTKDLTQAEASALISFMEAKKKEAQS